MSEKKVLILFAHPAFQKSRANRHLVDAVQNLDGVTFRDLYELYPDFNIQVAKEQQLLLDHDVIVFHVLDEAEVSFPFEGMVDLKDPETGESLVVDAEGIRDDYRETLNELRERYRKECLSAGADYVALDTSMPFDKALLEYLSQRKARF